MKAGALLLCLLDVFRRPWVAHPVEDAGRLLGVPNPKIGSGLSIGPLTDITLIERFWAGPAILGSQPESFEPSSNDMGRDSIEFTKLGERQIIIHGPPYSSWRLYRLGCANWSRMIFTSSSV